MGNIVELRGISKAFGVNQANKDIDFVCKRGEVVCLLGENGAGKSTLMKILDGQYYPDTGRIIVEGKEVRFTGAKDASACGIQMVHQHFMLVPTLTVADNIMIGKEVKVRGLYQRREAAEQARKLSEAYGLTVPAGKLVGDLSVGEQQRVEIIKALYHGAEVLILDEPTAVLTHQEIEELFTIIRQLRNSGKAIIFITHKLKETMAISDRVYVMREGEMVGCRQTSETNMEELGFMMVGKRILPEKRLVYPHESVILQMSDVCLKNKYGYSVLNALSLAVHDHEILGIAGVEGNGQMELVETIMALNTDWQGNIELCGVSIKGKNTEALLAAGVSCIHADRQEYSIAMELDVPHNLLMGYQNEMEFHHGKHFLNWAKIKTAACETMEAYDVRPRDTTRTLAEFSGGNQQKFVVGREMRRHPKLMIAAHPTRGVDIIATAFIHAHLNALKTSGSAVLLISSDVDELLEISDRVAILYNGTVVACREPKEYTASEIGSLMGGKTNEA